MKMLTKVISTGLVPMLLVSSVGITAFADSSQGKEEVIYIMTSADGSVDNVYAVNIFGKGEVTDYGNYTDLKLLTTNDKITEKDGKITFTNGSDKAYMQGTLTDAEIPWNISITYFLDGKELTPSEVAGKSGRLEIKFSVTQNKKCTTDFYNAYALMANFTLDTELCENIVAEDATIADVGSDKQLSFTILAGKGIDTSITCDVKTLK